MTAQYHDAIDRREAKQRAMDAEAEPMCSCTDPVHPGDDDNCLIHGTAVENSIAKPLRIFAKSFT